MLIYSGVVSIFEALVCCALLGAMGDKDGVLGYYDAPPWKCGGRIILYASFYGVMNPRYWDDGSLPVEWDGLHG